MCVGLLVVIPLHSMVAFRGLWCDDANDRARDCHADDFDGRSTHQHDNVTY